MLYAPVNLATDKTLAYVGETIKFTMGTQPSTQSYNIEVRDQNNNVIGNCTTSEDTCSIDWNTTEFDPGAYTLTAHIFYPTQCSSTPVIVTLVPTCTLVSITPDKTTANIGEIITFNTNVHNHLTYNL